MQGETKTLFSLDNAAAVTCATMNPEFNPGWSARKGGRSPYSGFKIRSMRRSEMFASTEREMARKSNAKPRYCPWKLPPESTSPVSENTSGLSVALFSSMAALFRTLSRHSRTGP